MQVDLLNCRKAWYDYCYRARIPKAGAATICDERKGNRQRFPKMTVNK
jgi:hypothetical protein